MAPENPLDDELTRLFADDRLDLPVRADAAPAVLAGARRIRRRRAGLTSAAAGFVLVGVVVGAASFADFNPSRPVPPATVAPPPASYSSSQSVTTAPTTTERYVVPPRTHRRTRPPAPPTTTTTTTTPPPTPPTTTTTEPPWTANPLPGSG